MYDLLDIMLFDAMDELAYKKSCQSQSSKQFRESLPNHVCDIYPDRVKYYVLKSYIHLDYKSINPNVINSIESSMKVERDCCKDYILHESFLGLLRMLCANSNQTLRRVRRVKGYKGCED